MILLFFISTTYIKKNTHTHTHTHFFLNHMPMNNQQLDEFHGVMIPGERRNFYTRQTTKIYRDHDEAIIEYISKTYGALHTMEAIGRVYTEVRDDGSITPVFPRGEIARLEGVEGMPAYFNHCYPNHGGIPSFDDNNHELYTTPTEYSVPSGTFVSFHYFEEFGEMWGRVRFNNIPHDQIEYFRDKIHMKYLQFSIAYTLYTKDEINDHRHLLSNTTYYGPPLKTIHGYYACFFEISFVKMGDISGCDVVVVKASKDSLCTPTVIHKRMIFPIYLCSTLFY